MPVIEVPAVLAGDAEFLALVAEINALQVEIENVTAFLEVLK